MTMRMISVLIRHYDNDDDDVDDVDDDDDYVGDYDDAGTISTPLLWSGSGPDSVPWSLSWRRRGRSWPASSLRSERRNLNLRGETEGPSSYLTGSRTTFLSFVGTTRIVSNV